MDTKSPFKSKLNILGFVLAVSGLMMDPTFQGYLADVIPPEVMAKIISCSGILVMLLRTCCTSQGISLNREQ